MNKIRDTQNLFEEMGQKGILHDGVSIMTAGFYFWGRGESLLEQVFLRGYTNLDLITNDCSTPGYPEEGVPEGYVNVLLRHNRVSHLTISYKGPDKRVNEYVQKAIDEGRLVLDFVPQGTLVRRIRAAGEGSGGFYTNVGVGTPIEDGKESKVIDGRKVILERALGADIAFIKAHAADQFGNLVYFGPQANFNPAMATATKYVVAEVDNIITSGSVYDFWLPKGSLIGTPGNYVDAVVQSTFKPKGRFRPETQIDENTRRIVQRAALELKDGQVVNLGVGIPTAVTNYIPKNIRVWLQSENGILGMGRAAKPGEEIEGVVDAGGFYVTLQEGYSFFDSLTSFGMIDGGHVDVAMLGAMEVDQDGNLANWAIPRKMMTGIGGGMDLATNAQRLVILTEHQRSGKPKIRSKCSLPLTVPRKVDTIITEVGVIKVTPEGLVLKEIAPGLAIDDVVENTEARLIIARDIKQMAT